MVQVDTIESETKQCNNSMARQQVSSSPAPLAESRGLDETRRWPCWFCCCCSCCSCRSDSCCCRRRRRCISKCSSCGGCFHSKSCMRFLLMNERYNEHDYADNNNDGNQTTKGRRDNSDGYSRRQAAAKTKSRDEFRNKNLDQQPWPPKQQPKHQQKLKGHPRPCTHVIDDCGRARESSHLWVSSSRRPRLSASNIDLYEDEEEEDSGDDSNHDNEGNHVDEAPVVCGDNKQLQASCCNLNYNKQQNDCSIKPQTSSTSSCHMSKSCQATCKLKPASDSKSCLKIRGGENNNNYSKPIEVIISDTCEQSSDLKQQVDPREEEEVSYVTGENLLCNCSGRRRPTLAGLIELFEQDLCVSEPDSLRTRILCSDDDHDHENSDANPIEAINAIISTKNTIQQNANNCKKISTPTQTATVVGNENSNITQQSIRLKVNRRELARQQQQQQQLQLASQRNHLETETIMRDIITPIKYEPSDNGSNSSSSDDFVDLLSSADSATTSSLVGRDQTTTLYDGGGVPSLNENNSHNNIQQPEQFRRQCRRRRRCRLREDEDEDVAKRDQLIDDSLEYWIDSPEQTGLQNIVSARDSSEKPNRVVAAVAQQQQQQQQREVIRGPEQQEQQQESGDHETRGDGSRSSSYRCCCRRHLRQSLASPIERVAAKGVRVIPSTTVTETTTATDTIGDDCRSTHYQNNSNNNNHNNRQKQFYRKLTQTRWQPPTDDKKYELKVLENLSGGNRNRKGLEPRCHRSSLPSFVGANLGPPIVKHRPSNSRSLVNQLARIKRSASSNLHNNTTGLSPVGPRHSKRRSQSAQQVEELIEQLERVTSEWAEDEHLLDRAERRDWPAKFQQDLVVNCSRPSSSNNKAHGRTPDTRPSRDFGFRSSVEQFEQESIARSHQNLLVSGTPHQPTMGTSSSSAAYYSTLAAAMGPIYRPSPVADRYRDDLAVRRLASRSPSLSSPRTGGGGSHCAPTCSYLLCSNAYTPTIEGRTSANDEDLRLDRRLQADDLHYRSLRSRPSAGGRMEAVQAEPPFGVPRNPTNVSYLTATQRLSQTVGSKQQQLDRGNPFLGCNCSCHIRCGGQARRAETRDRDTGVQQQQQQRHQDTVGAAKTARTPDSRVSFAHPDRASGCRSADSGIGATQLGSPTPDLSARRRPADRSVREAALLPEQQDSDRVAATGNIGDTPSSRPQSRVSYIETALDEHLANDEIDLDLDLKEEICKCWTPTGLNESPAMEKVQAELSSTPGTKRRPQIRLESPRAKSPLVRVSTAKATREAISTSAPATRQGEGGLHKPVVIQTYSDSLKRRQKAASKQQTIECQYDFTEDDDDYDEQEDIEIYKSNVASGQGTTRPRKLTIYQSSEGSSTPNEISSSSSSAAAAAALASKDRQQQRPNAGQMSSQEHNQDKNSTINSAKRISSNSIDNEKHKEANRNQSSQTKERKKSINFSIGEYKPLNKQNLIIL